MEQSYKEGGRSSSLQTVMEFNQGVSGRKRKQEGMFVNFKKLETLPDNKLLNSLDLKLTKYSKYVNGYELICNKYDITKR